MSARVGRPVATHRVTWDGTTPTYHCDGGPDARCRWYPNCECEEYGPEHEGPGHEDVQQDECLIIPWLSNCDPTDVSDVRLHDDDGEDVQPPDGEIDPEWQGDCWTWAYADDDLQARAERGPVTS